MEKWVPAQTNKRSAEDVAEERVDGLENRVRQLEDGMEELASILREEMAEIRRKVGNR
jgi:chaperonin cofactor prefoldin